MDARLPFAVAHGAGGASASQGIGAAVVGSRFNHTPRSNRHTLVTELAESGAGDEVIMSIAGHVSRAMLSRYSHVRMEAKRRALDEIAARQRAADDKRRKPAEQQQAAVLSQSALVQSSHGRGNVGRRKACPSAQSPSGGDPRGTDVSVDADGSLPGLFPESKVPANVYVIIESRSTFGNTSISLDEAPLRSGCVHSTFMPRQE